MDSPISPDAHAAPEPATQTIERRPGVWAGFGIVALYFALQFGLGLLFGAMAGFAVMVAAGFEAARQHHAMPNARAVFDALRASPEIRVVVIVLTLATAAATLAWIVRRAWPAQWSRADLPGFGLTPPTHKSTYLAAVLLGAGVLLLGGPLTHLLAGKHPISQDVTVLAASVPVGMRVLLALLVVCVAPFIEELTFRGVLLSGLARHMPVGWAMLASAVVFGCVHLPDFKFAWYPVPTLVMLGLASAWLRVHSRSLWPSVTLHATNNCIAAAAWFFVALH